MELLEVMHVYFRGERQMGFAVVVVGLVLGAFVFWLFRTQSGGFMWGLVIPLGLLSLLGIGGGGFLAAKTVAQVQALEDAHAEDATAMARAEVERMERVNANWPRLKAGWGVVTVVALLLLFAMKQPWASGLGLSLMLIATLLFFVDVFAERRAAPYADALISAAEDS